MRADIHDGQEPTLQQKAVYIDARPLSANSTKFSCNARPDHTSGHYGEVCDFFWPLSGSHPESIAAFLNTLAR